MYLLISESDWTHIENILVGAGIFLFLLVVVVVSAFFSD